eukprot:4464537-Prorocentrum_lima.AAC.1
MLGKVRKVLWGPEVLFRIPSPPSCPPGPQASGWQSGGWTGHNQRGKRQIGRRLPPSSCREVQPAAPLLKFRHMGQRGRGWHLLFFSP